MRFLTRAHIRSGRLLFLIGVSLCSYLLYPNEVRDRKEREEAADHFLRAAAPSRSIQIGQRRGISRAADDQNSGSDPAALPGVWPLEDFRLDKGLVNYQDDYGERYLHAGMDLFTDGKVRPVRSPVQGTLVRTASCERKLSSLALEFCTVYILDTQGRTWVFGHVNASSLPRGWRSRQLSDPSPRPVIQRGQRFGRLARRWKKTHLHLSVIDSDGSYLNPMLLLAPLNQATEPVIRQIVIAADGTLEVEAFERVGTGPALSPYRILISVDDGAETVVHDFSRLPPEDPAFPNRIRDHEWVRPEKDVDRIYSRKSRGEPKYQEQRKLIFNIPRPVNDGRRHRIRVIVEDHAGNRATQEVIE